MLDGMNTAIVLTPSQQAAFDTLLAFARGEARDRNGLALLDGYAGTGKTTLVAELIRALRAEGPPRAPRHGAAGRAGEAGKDPEKGGEFRIAVAAPTNKAVRVLRSRIERLGIDFSQAPEPGNGVRSSPWAGPPPPLQFGSIHSFLGLQLEDREDGSQQCREARDSVLHEFHLVIVDECSMIERTMFERILLAKYAARVLFVGDSAQLPPIDGPSHQGGAGCESPTFRVPTLRLTLSEIVRQAEGNPIIALSSAIRDQLATDQKIGAQQLVPYLPIERPARAGLVVGGAHAAINIVLNEIQRRGDEDTRILAYTNKAVLAYNSAIHRALYGATEFPFALGEHVILHTQFEHARVLTAADGGYRNKTDYALFERLITSEEARIAHLEPSRHPCYPDIAAHWLVLELDRAPSVHVVGVYYPDDWNAYQAKVSAGFREYAALKQRLAALGFGAPDYERLDARRRDVLDAAWALKKAFAPLRHAYALTVHKSQGSTFDTALIDLADLGKMRDPFEYNRALYVAVTRPAKRLALVVA